MKPKLLTYPNGESPWRSNSDFSPRDHFRICHKRAKALTSRKTQHRRANGRPELLNYVQSGDKVFKSIQFAPT
jgi:hypothetical protein